MTQRFAQGFFESGVLPTYGLMIGMWCVTIWLSVLQPDGCLHRYTKSEQALRNPLWYSLGFSAGALGTVISYGLVHIQPSGLKIWQLLYIFWGAVTMAWGILAYLILPNSQGTMRGLTERQRYIVSEDLHASLGSLTRTSRLQGRRTTANEPGHRSKPPLQERPSLGDPARCACLGSWLFDFSGRMPDGDGHHIRTHHLYFDGFRYLYDCRHVCTGSSSRHNLRHTRVRAQLSNVPSRDLTLLFFLQRLYWHESPQL